MIRRGATLALALLLAGAPRSPVALAAGGDPGPRIAALVGASGLPADRIAVAVIDPADGRVVASHRGREAIMPASCLKVATTGAALLALGSPFPLRTTLLASPPARGGSAAEVPGDLWLVGRGDPGFSEHGPEGDTLRALDAFAAQVVARGIRVVRGDLVFDASWFSGARVHPSWSDAGASARWYAAEVDALTVNDSCVDVLVEPGRGEGAGGRVTLRPETGVVSLDNRVTTTATKGLHGFGFRLSPENLLQVHGRVWTGSSGATSAAAVHDPALLAADQVGRALARAGIRILGSVRRPREGETVPRGAALLAEHATPLAGACAVANTRSQNLWAEMVLRVLGRERAGEGSFAGGVRALRDVLAPAGVEVVEDLRPVDGSGLSRENRASALSLGRVLALLHRSPARDAYFGGMARPGTGTLDDRFREERFRDRVFAKTGTLRGVSGLCGLALDRDGRPYVFAVLGERIDVGRCRTLQDGVVAAIVDGGGSGSGFRGR